MSFYIAAVAKRFPKVAPISARIASKEIPMDTLREQIWSLRTEYWARKLGSIPETWATAKVDACAAVNALKSPGNITYRQFFTGLVFAVQVAGCFCIGEMIARRSITGYDKAVGIAEEHH